MNNAHPPLDNVKVREAIAHAIDRKAIIDGAQFGYGTPIGSFFPPGDPAYIDLTGAVRTSIRPSPSSCWPMPASRT